MNTSGLGSLLWFLALGAFFYFMMRMGGCGGGHERRSEGSEEHGRDGAWDQPGSGGSGRGRPKDPVCGTIVEAAKAKTSVYRGQTYYFCSGACREKFEAAPASYATSDKGGCC